MKSQCTLGFSSSQQTNRWIRFVHRIPADGEVAGLNTLSTMLSVHFKQILLKNSSFHCVHLSLCITLCVRILSYVYHINCKHNDQLMPTLDWWWKSRRKSGSKNSLLDFDIATQRFGSNGKHCFPYTTHSVCGLWIPFLDGIVYACALHMWKNQHGI